MPRYSIGIRYERGELLTDFCNGDWPGPYEVGQIEKPSKEAE